MGHKERFDKLLSRAVHPRSDQSYSANSEDFARNMEAAGIKLVPASIPCSTYSLPDYSPGGTCTAVIHPCPICGEAGQQGYAGTPPCFETRSKQRLAALKRKGCVKGIALHTCSGN